MFSCTFEITVGDKTQSQTMEAPRIMLEQNFEQLVGQAAQDTRPIKVKMKRMQRVYNNFDEEWVEREFSVAFANNKYIEIC